MDEKDIRILMAVAKEGTHSPDIIQEITGIPKSTVHYRLNKLREEEVLKNDLYDIDLEKIGISITLITEVYAEFGEGYHETVGDQLSEIEGVNQVYFTMGDTDFVVVAYVTSRKMVEDLIEDYESIKEIQRTSSKFVVKTVKNEPYPINDFEYETLIDTIDND